jgi:hypothetical protein
MKTQGLLRKRFIEFSKRLSRLPNLKADEMRRLDIEQCEDIYRGLVLDIMQGESPSGSVAVRALEHKARINGYAVEPKQTSIASRVQISVHWGGEAASLNPRSIYDGRVPRRRAAAIPCSRRRRELKNSSRRAIIYGGQ